MFEKAIQPFVELAQKNSGKKVADIIQQAISHPNTFVFSELLQVDSVQQLKNTEFQKDFDVLNLFAFGTYADYIANPNKYPKLTDKQLYKLKQLSIVTITSKQRVLQYNSLLKSLDIQDVRTLEDMLIDSMYLGLISGKLDQKLQTVEITETFGRDLQDGDVQQMLQVLNNWLSRTKDILKVLQTNSENAAKAYEENEKQREAYEERIEEMKKNIKATLEMSTEMDFEEHQGRRRGRMH